MKVCRYLLLGSAALAIAPVMAQPIRLNVQGPYVQAASGMAFPESVDDFRRVSVLQYKPDGTDMSAGYVRAQLNAEIVATAYSFPSPTPPAVDPGQPVNQVRNKVCGAVAAGIIKGMETANPSAQRLQTNLTALTQNGVVQNGYHALYSMTVPTFLNRQQEAVKSEAYVFCYGGGKWTVEYRFTYPAATDAGPSIAQFMNDLKWTFAQ
jgi:hypothetical protein